MFIILCIVCDGRFQKRIIKMRVDKICNNIIAQQLIRYVNSRARCIITNTLLQTKCLYFLVSIFAFRR